MIYKKKINHIIELSPFFIFFLYFNCSFLCPSWSPFYCILPFYSPRFFVLFYLFLLCSTLLCSFSQNTILFLSLSSNVQFSCRCSLSSAFIYLSYICTCPTYVAFFLRCDHTSLLFYSFSFSGFSVSFLLTVTILMLPPSLSCAFFLSLFVTFISFVFSILN